MGAFATKGSTKEERTDGAFNRKPKLLGLQVLYERQERRGEERRTEERMGRGERREEVGRGMNKVRGNQ